MRHRKAASRQFGKEWLHIAQDRLARGRIADMAKGRLALQPFNGLGGGKMIADEAEPALRMKAALVEGHDAGSFLAAMLEGVKSECGQGSGIRMAEDTEDTAFFAQQVAVQIEVEVVHCGVVCP